MSRSPLIVTAFAALILVPTLGWAQVEREPQASSLACPTQAADEALAAVLVAIESGNLLVANNCVDLIPTGHLDAAEAAQALSDARANSALEILATQGLLDHVIAAEQLYASHHESMWQSDAFGTTVADGIGASDDDLAYGAGLSAIECEAAEPADEAAAEVTVRYHSDGSPDASYVRRRLGDLSNCGSRYGVSGPADIEVQLNELGRVVAVTIETDIHHEAVTCVEQRVRRWRFDEGEPRAMDVSVTFELANGDPDEQP